MQLECKFNGMPVGYIEINDEIKNGIVELLFDAYRSFAHLEMCEQFKTGIPTFIEVEIDGNLIYLKLLEHNGNIIKVQKSEKPIQKERKFGSMKGLVKNIADDFDEPLEDFEEYT